MPHSVRHEPTPLEIVKDNDMEGKLLGKWAVITGSSSATGIEIVRALAATGLRLILPVPNQARAIVILGDAYNPNRMEFVTIDHTSLDSVREAAKHIISKTEKISLLVCNETATPSPSLQLTKDGFEMQFATNHLSHFLLFQLLKPELLAASRPRFQSRVIMVACAEHRKRGLNGRGNYNFEKEGYNSAIAYAQSKTANVYMANEIERRYGTRGLHAFSTNSGRFIAGELQQDGGESLHQNPQSETGGKSCARGTSTTIWGAIGREWEGKGGINLSHCTDAPSGDSEENMPSTTGTENTYNPAEEARLWEDSLDMIGLLDDQ
ncbi:unnamed protein product [Clonostachys chloroleuca]|uniref:Uncharacterized protein n=1 Tax=Clonostachys chloroleuca TaxID=1926264 RepID=A0AA35ME65_9HYPO|nr:unnamed protein product [Clonostachys chloroleuca]